MALVETSKLKGAALDWAVAQAQDYAVYIKHHKILGTRIYFQASGLQFSPSELWMHGGEIIEREEIGAVPDGESMFWYASIVDEHGKRLSANGKTPLIAAMRCYVTSKLGNSVEIPEELL